MDTALTVVQSNANTLVVVEEKILALVNEQNADGTANHIYTKSRTINADSVNRWIVAQYDDLPIYLDYEEKLRLEGDIRKKLPFFKTKNGSYIPIKGIKNIRSLYEAESLSWLKKDKSHHSICPHGIRLGYEGDGIEITCPLDCPNTFTLSESIANVNNFIRENSGKQLLTIQEKIIKDCSVVGYITEDEFLFGYFTQQAEHHGTTFEQEKEKYEEEHKRMKVAIEREKREEEEHKSDTPEQYWEWRNKKIAETNAQWAKQHPKEALEKELQELKNRWKNYPPEKLEALHAKVNNQYTAIPSTETTRIERANKILTLLKELIEQSDQVPF